MARAPCESVTRLGEHMQVHDFDDLHDEVASLRSEVASLLSEAGARIRMHGGARDFVMAVRVGGGIGEPRLVLGRNVDPHAFQRATPNGSAFINDARKRETNRRGK